MPNKNLDEQESAAAYQDFCLKNQRRSMEDVLKKLAAKGIQNDFGQERERMNGDKWGAMVW